MKPILTIPLLVLVTLLAWPAMVGAVDAPAGNTLPEPPPADPYALDHLVEPHDTHGGDEDGHDHAHHAHDGHDHGHAHDPHTAAAPGEVMSREAHDAFADAVDLDAFRNLAVFDGGRVKIIETLAGEHIERIYGKQRWTDLETGRRYDPVFTYLDLIFNKRYYLDKPMIHVEVLPVRRQLVSYLPQEEQETWLRRGRVTPLMLVHPHAQALLAGESGDLKQFEAMQAVVHAAVEFDRVGERLLMISPPPGQDKWMHLFEMGERAPAVNEQVQALATAWRAADAEAVNRSLAALADLIPQVHPESYPSESHLQLEAIYNATHRFTLGWVAYLGGTIALLLAFAIRRRWLITTGAALLVAGFLVHTGGMIVRGILSGRWPIHNQFESFVAVTWFAVLVGIVFMFVRRQWLFGAAAAALGTCSLLVANTMDVPSNDVAPVAAILATSRILYIHVNTVLVSYALIGLGFFISLFYLGVHYTQNREALRMAAAGLGDVQLDDEGRLPGRSALLGDLDRAQMIVLQLAFWLLGVGTLLGAYWADHAWGRWWGWDPKETWALITWIVYLIAIHVRFGVRQRGLVTAWLSVLGFVTMLWCYWGVNMLLAGLHSYA